ncbi:hypothetical protein GIB67_030816 [Kingdonia uniflora]|uniref:Uncharacterized protein n=1 Tax=Kingdonia uniflora TaxID=39325 RepID=A0A7J7L399_9MAGN|nr:hypothetical protein GIB67_030816 [Kingdonia uniflora]
MDNLLCDELLQEIMQRLPSFASSNVSLVNKRWLHLHRSSKTSLSLKLNNNNNSYLLSLYPFISSLSIISETPCNTYSVSDDLLCSVLQNCSKNLRKLRFFAGPVSSSALFSLSVGLNNLTSLTITISSLGLNWIVSFPCLKDLCFTFSNLANQKGDDVSMGLVENSKSDDSSMMGRLGFNDDEMGLVENSLELPLESLSLSGIEAGNWGLGWLWRSCRNLRRLRLRSCEGTGDGISSSSFAKCLNQIEELELRTCRCIVDIVLLQLEENCDALRSLLLYDGGSRGGLHRFIIRSKDRLNLRSLDLRLPLDLDNNHLTAIGTSFRCLASLRLQSCCLVTGEGLNAIGLAMSDTLEELSLINCDVVEREPGLLTTLGQNLRGLKRLDLSYNEMLLDKEFVSMIVSCKNLVDIKLRGCRKLTRITMVTMLKSCKFLEDVDVRQCWGIEEEGVEVFVGSSLRLRRIEVDERKVSDATKAWASRRFIEVVYSV